jgi:hypothetical protein
MQRDPFACFQAMELIWIHRELVRLRAALLNALLPAALRGPEFFVHVKGYKFQIRFAPKDVNFLMSANPNGPLVSPR